MCNVARECICDIVVAYVTLWYLCISYTRFTFWLIFLGRACLDTWIQWLNPEYYDQGHKNMDSMVWFAFGPITTWSNLFCCIWKLHMQLRLWLCFITFGGCSAHLVYHIHKSGHKTRIINNHHHYHYHIHSHTYGIVLIHLPVFHILDIRITHTAYMESQLKTTHHLFKWCRRLKAVFIPVYWLRVLGNLKFNLYSESENCYG